MDSIDIGVARRAAFMASGLLRDFPPGVEGAAAALRRLSSIQIDTISVVERAHHHALWSRVPRYPKGSFAALEASPRRAIEYWSHAAAYVPIEEYRYCLPRMERVRREGHDWFKADDRIVGAVLDRIRAEGPLRAQDFERRPPGSKGWWDWKPAKIALEYLFHSGTLISTTRVGFQKLYDLAERALPPGIDLGMPTEAEMAAYYVDIAQRALGVFGAADVAYQRRDLTGAIPEELERRVAEGRLAPCRLEGAEAKRDLLYAAPDLLGVCASPLPGKARASILSPFDPLVIDRRRLRRTFDFQYNLECYLPEAKRSFGYFALPIAFRAASGEVSMVGLVDAKADRASQTLILRHLSLSGVAARQRASLAAALSAEVWRFAAFNGCEGVSLERLDVDDDALEARLRAALESRGELAST
jgi:uncharacterized protein YcaQ